MASAVWYAVVLAMYAPAAALAACIVLTACSDYVGKEATHPLYAKYETSKSAKSYREAAESLEEFLTICPKSPKAHYDAAILYKEIGVSAGQRGMQLRLAPQDLIEYVPLEISDLI